jgi:hypothetical protein
LPRSTTESPSADSEAPLRISAIVPVRDGRATLGECLEPLLARVGTGLVEVIVCDDGSLDGSGDLARERGARVLRSEVARGPAAARNRGAEEASGEVLFFVDADVVVRPDAVDRIAECLRDESVSAVFGCYDEAPRDPGLASRYMNLRHRHFHQQATGDVSSFWAGCGAIRSALFRSVGGFDAASFSRPTIEDIALGNALVQAGGRIRMEPSLQGTHLKRWSWLDVLRTDIVSRALPWGRLVAAGKAPGGQLNASASEVPRVLVAWSLLGATLLAITGSAPAWIPLLLLGVAGALNRPLLSLFHRVGGISLVAFGLLQHQLYYLYGSAIFVWCRIERILRLRDD